MKTWVRKLRGILGIGAIWGVAGSVLGFALGAIVSMIWPEVLPTTVVKYVLFMALQHGVTGFVFGSGFAGVLTIMDGRKTIEELTPKRAALWGALVGASFPIIIGLMVMGLGFGSDLPLAELIFAGLGSCCVYGAMTAGVAAGTVSLARGDLAELGTGAVLDESKLLNNSVYRYGDQFGPIWRS